MSTQDPYFDVTFFGWFATACGRLLSSTTKGGLCIDEVQVIVLGLFALSAGYLGVFLVAKRLTMMANALSHTMLLGVVLAVMAGYALKGAAFLAVSDQALVFSALGVGLVTSVCTQHLSTVKYLHEDSSNGIVFSGFFALAITLVSLWSKNAHIGPELLMGDPDGLRSSDIPMVFLASTVALVLGGLCTRALTVSMFDREFAAVLGFRPPVFIHLLLLLVSLVSLVSFRAIGFVMTLSFFVLPALIARYLTPSLVKQLLYAPMVGLATIVFSVALSRHVLTVYALPLSTGSLSATILAGIFGCCLVTGQLRNRCLRRRISQKNVHEVSSDLLGGRPAT